MFLGFTCTDLGTVWLAVIILGRDVGLAISAIYYRWISLPPPKTMARYWDFSLPSAEVKPTEISKINTALQLVLVGSAIALPVVPEAIISTWHLSEAMTGFQYVIFFPPPPSFFPYSHCGLFHGWVDGSLDRLKPLLRLVWYIRPQGVENRASRPLSRT